MTTATPVFPNLCASQRASLCRALRLSAHARVRGLLSLKRGIIRDPVGFSGQVTHNGLDDRLVDGIDEAVLLALLEALETRPYRLLLAGKEGGGFGHATKDHRHSARTG